MRLLQHLLICVNLSGYVPTPEHERDEAMPSDLGERKEVIPQEPESNFSEDFEELQLLGSLLRQHEARGHWPYDKGCDSCVQAREGLLPGDVVMKEEMIKVVKIQQPVNYQYLHTVRSAVLASARKHTKPKHKETSTNVEATLFTTNKEGTYVVVTYCYVGSSAHLLVFLRNNMHSCMNSIKSSSKSNHLENF